MVETVMKTGDIIRLSDDFAQMEVYPDMFKLYIVRRVEKKNNWVFVFGKQGPLSMALMEVISESR
tara:strand:+ start:726 stop:920 length:195 start_codon:yes stop_codon:yes gene_type:complete